MCPGAKCKGLEFVPGRHRQNSVLGWYWEIFALYQEKFSIQGIRRTRLISTGLNHSTSSRFDMWHSAQHSTHHSTDHSNRKSTQRKYLQYCIFIVLSQKGHCHHDSYANAKASSFHQTRQISTASHNTIATLLSASRN